MNRIAGQVITKQRTTIVLPEQTTDTEIITTVPWWVLLHNDDKNFMDHVGRVLVKIMDFDPQTAFSKMMEAHKTGLSHLATYDRKEAELRAELLFKHNLVATIEPA